MCLPVKAILIVKSESVKRVYLVIMYFITTTEELRMTSRK